MLVALTSLVLAKPPATVGWFVGPHLAGPNHELYQSPGTVHKPLGPSFQLGARGSFPILGPLGGEGELHGGPVLGVGGGVLGGLRVGLVGTFPTIEQRVTPLLIAGVGLVGITSRDLGDDLDRAAHVGPAVRVRLSERIGVRVDLRYLLSARVGTSRIPGGHTELLFGLYWSGPDLSDADHDGISAHLDECPRAPETTNGFEDSDGCPDQLSRLELTLQDADGGLLADTLVCGQGSTDARGVLTLEGRMPGDRWTLDCKLAGMEPLAVDLVLEEGNNPLALTVDFEPGSLLLVARDAEGQPVQATVFATGPGTVEYPLGDDGTEIGKLAPGTWTFRFEADGFTSTEQVVELVDLPGKRTRIQAELQRPRAPVSIAEPVIAEPVFVEDVIAVFEPITFNYDSHTLTPASVLVVHDVARVMLSQPGILRVEVAGHASSEGRDDYNLQLSQRRVEEVVRVLSSQGVDGRLLTPKGYGEAQPIADNDTAAGRALNRRVVFHVRERAR